MTSYGDLEIGVPFLLSADDEAETWVTRSEAGHTTELRPKAGSLMQRARDLGAVVEGAIAVNDAYLALPTVGADELVAQVRELTTTLQAMLRLQRGQLDEDG